MTTSARNIPSVVLVNGIPYSTSSMYDVFMEAPRFCQTQRDSQKPQEIGKIIAMMNDCGEKESMRKLKAHQHWLQLEANRVNYEIDEISSETARTIVRDTIRTLTVFEGYSYWNITEAAKRYNITGADALCAIVSRNGKNESKYRKLFENTTKQRLWFKDIDGATVDNPLPVGNDDFVLCMRVFGGTLYNPIVRLLSSKVK